MDISTINSNNSNRSFKGTLLRTKTLEKYISKMNSAEFDVFTSNIKGIKSVEDGKKYAFIMSTKALEHGNGLKMFKGILKEIKQNKILGSHNVEVTDFDKPYFYAKKNVDTIFNSLWDIYPSLKESAKSLENAVIKKPKESAKSLETRKKAFINELEEYTK